MIILLSQLTIDPTVCMQNYAYIDVYVHMCIPNLLLLISLDEFGVCARVYVCVVCMAYVRVGCMGSDVHIYSCACVRVTTHVPYPTYAGNVVQMQCR